jgi:hypothetical protein
MKLDGLATGIADCAPVAVLIDVTEVEAESLSTPIRKYGDVL